MESPRSARQEDRLLAALDDYDSVLLQAIKELSEHAMELTGWQRTPLDEAVEAMRATRARHASVRRRAHLRTLTRASEEAPGGYR